MFEEIVTVTLEPMIHVILWLKTLVAQKENQVEKEETLPSGSGLNVSRILAQFSIQQLAVGCCGADSAQILEKLLVQYHIPHFFIPSKGADRQRLTLILPKTPAMQIVRGSGFCEAPAYALLREKLCGLQKDEKKRLFVLSGVCPSFMTQAEFYEMLVQMQKENAALAFSAADMPLAQLSALAPFAVALTLDQLKKLTKVNFRSEAAVLRYCGGLTNHISHILIDIGEKGFLYIGKEISYRVIKLSAAQKNFPDAQDYCLAGFLAALMQGKPLVEALSAAAVCVYLDAGGQRHAFYDSEFVKLSSSVSIKKLSR